MKKLSKIVHNTDKAVLKIWRLYLKRLTCKHKFLPYRDIETTALFGSDHTSKVCVKCGKRLH